VLNAHLHAPPPKLDPPGAGAVIAKALSKSPLDRYGSCGEFVAAARAAAAERRVHGGRLTVSLAVLVAAALVGAGAALGVRSLVSGGSPHATPPPPPQPPPAAKPSLGPVLLRSTDAPTLGNIAFALIKQHHYAEAIPFARKSVRLAAPGTTTLTYSTYNLGVALYHVGRCKDALVQLRRALPMEVPSQQPIVRHEINLAQKCATK
jgi:hypothetical protein